MSAEQKLQSLEAIAAIPTRPPADVAATLKSLPDLRPVLESYGDEELAELFDAFDLEARYSYLEKTLKLSVAVFPELEGLLEHERPPQATGRSKSFTRPSAHRVRDSS